MGLDYFLALFPGALGIVVVHAYHIRRECPAVVHIGLAIGHPAPDEILVDLPHMGLGGIDTRQKFISGRVVILRFFNGNAVFKRVGQANAVVIGLDQIVSGSVWQQCLGADSP